MGIQVGNPGVVPQCFSGVYRGLGAGGFRGERLRLRAWGLGVEASGLLGPRPRPQSFGSWKFEILRLFHGGWDSVIFGLRAVVFNRVEG